MKKMKAEPVFHRDYRVLSREEQREVVHQRWKKIVEWGLFKDVSASEMLLASLLLPAVLRS